jgi:hypothetical protein
MLPALVMLRRASMPVYEFQGTITSIQVKSHTRSYGAILDDCDNGGGSINVHVSNPSEFWRNGQRLKVRYYGNVGELIKATFIAENGEEQGETSATTNGEQIFSIAVGIFIAFLIWWQYRRDPHRRIESRREPSGLYDSVDQRSLLHLSKKLNDSVYGELLTSNQTTPASPHRPCPPPHS